MELFATEPRVLFRLTVQGHPEPAGSKKALPLGGKHGGRPIVVDANPKAKPWKNTIARQAQLAMVGLPIITFPVEAEFKFWLLRPASHFNASGKLKPRAPRFPGVRPDLLKFARAAEDALTDIVYEDDALIVTEILKKRYSRTQRMEIIIREATLTDDDECEE